MESFIADIQSEYEEELQQVIAGSDVELTTESEDGVRLIRNRETNLGDSLRRRLPSDSGS